MLFLSIVFGFGAVSVLANLSIQTNIQNARQTIMRVTLTDDGTDGGNLLLDFNTGSRIFISDAILDPQTSFSGKVLGLDADNKIIYVPASGLVVSGVTSNGSNGDTFWTGAAGSSIINTNTGSVYVGGNPTDATKFYVKSAGNAQAIFEETNASNAANIWLQNTVNSWRIGGFAETFYIGNNSNAILTINTGGRMGLNTRGPQYTLHIKDSNSNAGMFIGGTGDNSAIRLGNSLSDRRNLREIKNQFSDGSLIWSRNNSGNRYPSILMESGGNVGVKINAGNSVKATLQVSGTFIAGDYSNSILGINSSIGGGAGNYISGGGSFIGAGGDIIKASTNKIYGDVSFIGAGEGNIITGNYGVIGGGDSNKINKSNNSVVGGGNTNTISGGNYNTIIGGSNNGITGSTVSSYSSILGGRNNLISGASYSVVGGYQAYALHNNSFVWNSDIGTIFQTTKRNIFIINAPIADDPINGGTMGGVGINTASPAAALDVNGTILSNSTIAGSSITATYGIAGSSITATYGMTANSFKVSSQSTGSTCNNGTRGTIIMSGNNFYGCNGTTWKQLDN